MATFLYKLGQFAFRRRWFVLVGWLLALGLAGFGAATAPTTAASQFSIPGTESQRAFDLLAERFPGMSADGATARVVFKAPDGAQITQPVQKAKVEKVLAELKTAPGVQSVTDPYQTGAVSQTQAIAYTQVTYKVNAVEFNAGQREHLLETVEHGRDGGLTVEVGGDAVQAKAEGGVTEAIGVGVSAVVLLLTFGSLVAAGLPLFTALLGIGVSVAGITALSSTFEFNSTTPVLATMIGLAVGIDYALFIVSRHRSELAAGRAPLEAVGRAVGTAGSAVVFAGLTVIIALAGLAVINLPLLTKMGVAAAAAVVVAVLVALTLIPALLGLAGDKVRSRKDRKSTVHVDEEDSGLGVRWANLVLRRPVAVLLAGVVGLGVMAIPVADLTLALPDEGSQPVSTTQRKAYDLLSEGFGPGFNGTLLTVVDVSGSQAPQQAAQTVVAEIQKLKGVVAVTPPTFNQAGDTALVTVIPATNPSSPETERLVHAIRDTGSDLEAETDADLLVSGQTAVAIDLSEKLDEALVPYLALVVGLAFLLLILVFRSILVPLKAALGFLLSVLAALGAVVAVFQWGWLKDLFGLENPGPIMSMMPIFMVGVVFGLAMDYEVFLVTRMREAHVHGESPEQSVITGFQHGARVVTAAAIIMISVFAGFIGMDDAMVKMIGFGLAIAVFLDAFVVRMAIVPAVLALLGKSAWWLPGWLDKALPNVDVEGERLNTHLAEKEPEVLLRA
ncbi:MMPL family transporter [Actinocorallia sp. B10E7]|uniref:MMPL family transporter n=1 Tax=Actinocorallia sp. B10E7 TaxID=3153558 RepID=UPI00325F45FE